MPGPGQVHVLLGNRYRFAVGVLLSTVLVFIGPATAWADATMTLDLVRHAQDTALVDPKWISTTWPGPGLTSEGLDQAQQVADKLSGIPFEGIYASQFLRTQETAAPLAKDRAHAAAERLVEFESARVLRVDPRIVFRAQPHPEPH